LIYTEGFMIFLINLYKDNLIHTARNANESRQWAIEGYHDWPRQHGGTVSIASPDAAGCAESGQKHGGSFTFTWLPWVYESSKVRRGRFGRI